MTDFSSWTGRTQDSVERCDAWPVKGLQALLGEAGATVDGDEIPPLGHWLFFAPTVPQGRIGPDGHPQRGDFLPPLPQPRRMWAASEVIFDEPLKVGQILRKSAQITQIVEKPGKSGALVFVTVQNVYEAEGRRALSEKQTLVYREDAAPGTAPPPPRPAPADSEWSLRIDPDPVLLFRYSAVTFNAHRIHYDLDYARDVEGYAGPVVQGQLTATLMLQALLRDRPGTRVTRFSFRAVQPLFSGAPFFVEGRSESNSFLLWARDDRGNLAMTAEAAVQP